MFVSKLCGKFNSRSWEIGPCLLVLLGQKWARLNCQSLSSLKNPLFSEGIIEGGDVTNIAGIKIAAQFHLCHGQLWLWWCQNQHRQRWVRAKIKSKNTHFKSVCLWWSEFIDSVPFWLEGDALSKMRVVWLKTLQNIIYVLRPMEIISKSYQV